MSDFQQSVMEELNQSNLNTREVFGPEETEECPIPEADSDSESDSSNHSSDSENTERKEHVREQHKLELERKLLKTAEFKKQKEEANMLRYKIKAQWDKSYAGGNKIGGLVSYQNLIVVILWMITLAIITIYKANLL